MASRHVGLEPAVIRSRWRPARCATACSYRLLAVIAGVLAANVGALCCGARAEAAITVSLVDGQTAAGEAVALSGGRLTLTSGAGASLGQWRISNVARIDFGRAGPQESLEGAASIRVTGGVLRGIVKSFDGTAFKVASADFGDLDLPAPGVEAVVWLEAAGERLPNSDEAGDAIVLRNFDRLSGTLNSLDEKVVKFHSDLGDTELELSRVAAVKIGPPKTGRPKQSSPALKVRLPGGTAIELAEVEIGEGTLQGKLPGGIAVAAPLEKVLDIEVVGGRLVPLESLEPVAYEQHSLDILKWEIQHGRNVKGEPMQLRSEDGKAAVAFTRGLGVHGPCRVAYRLDGKYERFLALVGIDESAGRLADVNIVVKADGKELMRADHVKHRQPAVKVNVPVSGVRQLELIVETGENYDVLDRVNWAEARLIAAEE